MIKTYGIIGLAIIFVTEILLFKDVAPIPTFFTPIIWWGYILFTDSLVLKMRGASLITSYSRSFLFMLPISIGCWMIFELYNLRLLNWEYVNMSESYTVRFLGYILAFATITPGIYETAHLIQAIFFPEGTGRRKISFSNNGILMIGITGAAFMIIPLLVPKAISSYLFALVWIGVVPLLDTVNRRLGAPSLLSQLERGDWSVITSFLLSGVVCGFLWEFWNFWALTKWVYHIPFWSSIKIFEMPLVGFPGFLPFALECYVMFNFCAHFLGLEPVSFPTRK